MAKAKSKPSSSTKKLSPARTPEGQEQLMISLAVDLAEKQLREGTASSQVITHYLKLGSSREKLEQERLKNENKLTSAKTDALEEAKDAKELFNKALDAMRRYSGNATNDGDNYE